jgi:hypothetical protein
MMVFLLSKWAIRKINKNRRQFLWHRTDDMRHGNCLVNWKQVQRPKRLGRLRILDLKRFNRALHLIWKWKQWKCNDRPGSRMLVLPSQTESDMFRACSTINIGNENNTRFWSDKWLHRESPIDLAPALFRLTWRKNLTVVQVLNHGNWMKKLCSSFSYGNCSA